MKSSVICFGGGVALESAQKGRDLMHKGIVHLQDENSVIILSF